MASNANMTLSKKAEEIEAERVAKIRENHRLLCAAFPFEIIRDKADESILGFEDVDRVEMNLHGKETSHADICLRNYLQHPELYAADKPVKGCKCKAVLAFTKREQALALADVPPHIQELRRRNLTLFNVGYKNYLKAVELRV